MNALVGKSDNLLAHLGTGHEGCHEGNSKSHNRQYGRRRHGQGSCFSCNEGGTFFAA